MRVLLIEEGLPIDKEFYLGIVLDRASGRPVFMASEAGGMDIEQVAADTPEKILKETVDPAVGFRAFQARKLAFGLGIRPDLINQAVKFMQSLYLAYEQMDASLMEINPFLLTRDNRLIALDAKVNFDDNALFRHKEFLDLRDLNEEDPLEIEASKFDLNYIKLDGNIACMVNGAGLAMATMDIIKLDQRAAKCACCLSKRACRSIRSSIWASCWIARRDDRCSWLRRPAEWTLNKWPQIHRKKF